MQVITFISPRAMMDERCYLIIDDKRTEAVVIDPDKTGREILNYLRENKIVLKMILLTHGHFDHIGSVAELHSATSAVVAIHEMDADMLTDARLNLSGYFGAPSIECPAGLLTKEGMEIPFSDDFIRVIHTPGHTPGSCCFLLGDRLFSGDTLFQGSIGRTDFPGGDGETLMTSIREKLMTMPANCTVYPGHGQPTTLEREKQSNPYL